MQQWITGAREAILIWRLISRLGPKWSEIQIKIKRQCARADRDSGRRRRRPFHISYLSLTILLSIVCVSLSGGHAARKKRVVGIGGFREYNTIIKQVTDMQSKHIHMVLDGKKVDVNSSTVPRPLSPSLCGFIKKMNSFQSRKFRSPRVGFVSARGIPAPPRMLVVADSWTKWNAAVPNLRLR